MEEKRSARKRINDDASICVKKKQFLYKLLQVSIDTHNLTQAQF